MRPRSRGSSEGLLHAVSALPSHFQVAQWTNPNHCRQVSRRTGQERQRRWASGFSQQAAVSGRTSRSGVTDQCPVGAQRGGRSTEGGGVAPASLARGMGVLDGSAGSARHIFLRPRACPARREGIGHPDAWPAALAQQLGPTQSTPTLTLSPSLAESCWTRLGW